MEKSGDVVRIPYWLTERRCATLQNSILNSYWTMSLWLWPDGLSIRSWERRRLSFESQKCQLRNPSSEVLGSMDYIIISVSCIF